MIHRKESCHERENSENPAVRLDNGSHQVRRCKLWAIVEAPIGTLGGIIHGAQCPVCRSEFRKNNANVLADLAKAIMAVTDIKDRVEVEFVILAKD